MFIELAELNYERGPVGAGIITGGFTQQVSYYRTSDWLNILKMRGPDSDLASFMILGHCRAPTGGSSSFLHPHQLTGKHGDSYFAHNGMILDMEALSFLSGIEDKSQPDSVHLHKLLVANADAHYILNTKDYLSDFDIPGSFTFWWYYQKMLILARLQGTLWYDLCERYLIFSSTQSQDTPQSMMDGDLLYVSTAVYCKDGFSVGFKNPLL